MPPIRAVGKNAAGLTAGVPHLRGVRPGPRAKSLFVPETRWTGVRRHGGHIFPSREDGLLLLLRLWNLWVTRSVVHKSTGFVVGLVEVDGADAMGAIVHGEHPILVRRAESDRLAAQGPADAPRPVLEADEAVAVDLADLVAGGVLDRRRNLGNGRELGR